MILQSDNGPELHGAAMNDRQRKLDGTLVSLTNNDLAAIITKIKQLWPECQMVRVSPRHSQSNGGVERVNRTIQSKLGVWMTGNNMRRWSVGCWLMMWHYNTQQHWTVGEVPYHLVFGQHPRGGISRLHLEQDLLDRLATEADLNTAVEYEGQARVAVKSGLLKSWYVYHRLGRVTGKGHNVELNNGWESMNIISEREAARNESIVGGQGKGDMTCSCKGKCNSNHCSCKKAGRICASACHRNNFNCVNHDRVDMFLPK
jgi:hypothetical protein